ncbi:hypothetical protein O7623_25575 [Solwaraspora sp. WMMD791]|uniref:hypothetical protein n=1 Tax=Solwaraspora sp. WMMD791 TaxID=3016086 RepID=UPI00249BC2AE|nr:hypothetical protein [Solwaraspora sp. WMMD791]WFE26633.1 hypothetical protein O7623_25575 [Solwaraspora sp. WMMD791]
MTEAVTANPAAGPASRSATNPYVGPNDLPRYKAEFVDPIADILSRPARTCGSWR